MNVVKAYSDYLDKKTAQYWLPDSTGRVYQPNVEINPIYYRLFTPVTVYHSTVLRAMNGQLTDSLVVDSTEETQEDALLPVRMARIEQDEDITHAMDKALVYTYLNHPTLVRQTEDKVRSQRVFKEGIMPDSPRRQRMTDLIKEPNWNDPGVNQNLVIRKPNFWKHSASASLQFTQNYISSNWYKGGESNNTMLSPPLYQLLDM